MADNLQLDPRLKEWATPRQAEYLEAINLHGGLKAACRANKWDERSIYGAIRRLKKAAASQGYSPDHHMTEPVPDGFKLARHSQYYDKEGKPANKWVIGVPDKARQAEILRETAEALAIEIPRVAPIAAPANVLEHLLTLYTFTDYHLGALCWHKEGGADWDVKIALKTGLGAMQSMVAQAPASDTGVVNIQGDFFHVDGIVPITPRSGNVLDADSRFSKVSDIGIYLVRQLVSLALQKHAHVILVIMEGNHDESSSVLLRKLFKALYEDEPRVTVKETELPYEAIQWGNTMLGFHHGHMTKNDNLPTLFAAQFREMWGRCRKVYIHAGHRHHFEAKEHPGAKIIQHPTMAARDAFVARGGWWSEREITSYTYHDVFGQLFSNTVTPEMLENAA